MVRSLPSLVVVPLLFTACASPQPASPSGPAPAYTLVLIRTGPRTTPLAKAERDAMFQGHFGNMMRLARAGDLVMAGPYGQRKSAADLRGIMMLATADAAAAKALAETDPGFVQGEFRFEYHTVATDADLRAQLAADMAREDAIAASGRKPQPGEGGRGYVWLTSAESARLPAALVQHPSVLLQARLDGQGALLLLDAKDLATAQALLAPFAAELGDHRLDEWFGSGLLVDLPKRGRASR